MGVTPEECIPSLFFVAISMAFWKFWVAESKE